MCGAIGEVTEEGVECCGKRTCFLLVRRKHTVQYIHTVYVRMYVCTYVDNCHCLCALVCSSKCCDKGHS